MFRLLYTFMYQPSLFYYFISCFNILDGLENSEHVISNNIVLTNKKWYFGFEFNLSGKLCIFVSNSPKERCYSKGIYRLAGDIFYEFIVNVALSFYLKILLLSDLYVLIVSKHIKDLYVPMCFFAFFLQLFVHHCV